MIWFSSDHHFNHRKTITYNDRPYASLAEMNEDMVQQWNEVVALDDTVWYLGDFTLSCVKFTRKLIKQLNGEIHFLNIFWHHDRHWLKRGVYEEENHRLFIEPPLIVLEFPELGNDEYPLPITLSHYPLARWDRQSYGGWQLHGHSHGNYQRKRGRMLDVGVDNIYKLFGAYRPISLDEVVEYMKCRRT